MARAGFHDVEPIAFFTLMVRHHTAASQVVNQHMVDGPWTRDMAHLSYQAEDCGAGVMVLGAHLCRQLRQLRWLQRHQQWHLRYQPM
jgi:hypothetical protein